MSFVLIAPEFVTAAAGDLTNLGSSISAAGRGTNLSQASLEMNALSGGATGCPASTTSTAEAEVDALPPIPHTVANIGKQNRRSWSCPLRAGRQSGVRPVQ